VDGDEASNYVAGSFGGAIVRTWQAPDTLHGDQTALVVNWLQGDLDVSSLLTGGVVAEALYGYESDMSWVSLVRSGGISEGVFDKATFDVEVRAPLEDVAFTIMQTVRWKLAVVKHHISEIVGSRELYGPARREDAVNHLSVWGCAWQVTARAS